MYPRNKKNSNSSFRKLMPDTEQIQSLIKPNVDINEGITRNGSTRLYLAARRGQEEMVNSLLQHGADVNKARTSDGITPLYIAVVKRRHKIVDLLLQYNADANLGKNGIDKPLWVSLFPKKASHSTSIPSIAIPVMLIAKGADYKNLSGFYPHPTTKLLLNLAAYTQFDKKDLADPLTNAARILFAVKFQGESVEKLSEIEAQLQNAPLNNLYSTLCTTQFNQDDEEIWRNNNIQQSIKFIPKYIENKLLNKTVHEDIKLEDYLLIAQNRLGKDLREHEKHLIASAFKLANKHSQTIANISNFVTPLKMHECEDMLLFGHKQKTDPSQVPHIGSLTCKANIRS